MQDNFCKLILCVCVCVFVCAVLLHTRVPCLSNSAVQHSLYHSNGPSCHVLCPSSDHQSAVHSTNVIKPYQCQYSFCQTLQGADRVGMCRRTSSCHDSQTRNHENSRHCWTDMRPVNLYTKHEPCEQCRLLKVSLCRAYIKSNKLLCLVSHSSAEACCLPSPHFHINILIPIFWPFMTVTNNTGSDHTAGKLASPTLLLLYKSHALWWGSVCHEARLIIFCSTKCNLPSII